jgi:hypothetical protein
VTGPHSPPCWLRGSGSGMYSLQNLGDGQYRVNGVHVGLDGRYIVPEKKIVGFKTVSGAEYIVEGDKAARLPGSPELYNVTDGEWQTTPELLWLTVVTSIEEGESVYMSNGSKWRKTSYVTEVIYE